MCGCDRNLAVMALKNKKNTPVVVAGAITDRSLDSLGGSAQNGLLRHSRGDSRVPLQDRIVRRQYFRRFV